MKEFVCRHTYEDGETMEWTGTVTPVRKSAGITEAEIRGRGSGFTVIVGEYTHGRFLCIPAVNVGCPMSRWDDVFWNRERLASLMNETDAVTVAYGVKTLMGERVRNKKRGMEM